MFDGSMPHLEVPLQHGLEPTSALLDELRIQLAAYRRQQEFPEHVVLLFHEFATLADQASL